jgi:hypothetical protein
MLWKSGRPIFVVLWTLNLVKITEQNSGQAIGEDIVIMEDTARDHADEKCVSAPPLLFFYSSWKI